jgi:hypothetical protein
MSEFSTVLEKIRTILGMETINEIEEVEVALETEVVPEVVEPTEVTLAEATLEDGTIIYYDGTLAVDTAIFTDEALVTPIADETYILTNGDTFKVEAGIVVEYTPIVAEDTEEVKPEVEVEEELEVVDFEAKYNDLMVIVTELKSKLENFSSQKIALKSEIEKLSTQPEVESISQEPQDKRELSQIEKRMNTLEAIRNLRK